MIRRLAYRLRVLRDRIIPSDHRWFVVGDSHIGAFRVAYGQGLLDAPASFCMVVGATAVGLRNPNSLTNALTIFEQRLLPPKKGVIPVIHLGEVDCGFVIWWRSKRYGEPVDEQLAQSIGAYADFVDKLLAAGYPGIVVTGASMPTIRDGQDFGEIANLRREVTASLLERTDLTLRYNSELAKLAKERNLPFIDISSAILDKDTGVISDNFRHPDEADHHLNPRLAGRLWANELNRVSRPGSHFQMTGRSDDHPLEGPAVP